MEFCYGFDYFYINPRDALIYGNNADAKKLKYRKPMLK